MGLFDDLTKNIDGGIKAVQGWGAAATETLRNINPTTQAIGTELDKITGKNDDKLVLEKVGDTIIKAPETIKDTWEKETPKITETLRNINPTTQAIGTELDKITGKNDDKLVLEKVKEAIVDAPQNIEQGWNDLTENAGEILNNTSQTVTTTIEKTIIQPVKETVQNVTKGVSDALPIVAIGAGGLILASLILGRK